MKYTTKSVKILCGDDSCKLMLFDGTDSAALVHALSSRFRLTQLAFHLTYPGDDTVVPLTAALPGGTTLIVHVDGGPHDLISDNAEQEENIPVTPWSSETAAKLNSNFQSLLGSTALSRHDRDLERGCEIKKVGIPGAAAPGLDNTAFVLNGHYSGVEDDSPKFSSAREPLLQPIRAQSKEHILPCGTPIASPQVSPAVFSLVDSAMDNAMADVYRVVDRFSRLSSELANERTLLAWIRTALAGIRGVFAFFSIPQIEGISNGMFYYCQLVMMAAVIFGGVSGTMRYNRVRNALRLVDPPQDGYGRLSIMWFNATVAFLTIAIAIGVLIRGWST